MQLPFPIRSQTSGEGDTEPSTPLSERLMGVAFTCVVLAVVMLLGHLTGAELSLEARRRAWVVGDMLSGNLRGFEGLVGSLGLSPLPTLMMAAFGVLSFGASSPLLACVVSIFGAGALAVYLDSRWSEHGVQRPIRYFCMACVLMLPPISGSIQSGQSTTVFIALAIIGAGFMIDWVNKGSLRYLLWAGILFGLAIGVRHQALLLILVAEVVVIIAAGMGGRKISTAEGTALLFLLPTCGVLLMWMVGNWLVMGNPVFFLKAPFRALTLGSVDIGYLLAGACEWLALAAVVPVVLSVPVVCGIVDNPLDKAVQNAAAVGGVLLGLVLVFSADVSAKTNFPETDIQNVVEQVNERYPTAVVVVMGYRGYQFTGASEDESGATWVHIMHLDSGSLDRIMEAHPQKDVYLLVSGENPSDRWHYVGLEWRELHSRVPERFIFAREVGSWVLFECIRANEGSSVLGSV